MTSVPLELPPHLRRLAELAKTDPQLRGLMPDPDVTGALRRPDASYAEVIATALDAYADRPGLSERAYEVVVDARTGRRRRNLLPRFDAITYRQFHDRVKSLADAWRRHPTHRVSPGDFVCVLGFTGIDFATVDLACVYAGAVGVPLQTTLANADLAGILADTAPTVVAATVSDLVIAAELAGKQRSVHTLIVFDYDDEVDDDREQRSAAQREIARNGSSAEIVTLPELIRLGKAADWEPLPRSEEGDDRMALLVHSSGSTGTPKGVIITDRVAKRQWDPGPLPLPIVRLAFLPMNHMGGRAMVYMVLGRGGSVAFTASSDLSSLFEDMRLVRPTEAMFFPRVIEMIHQHYLGEVVRRTAAGGDGDSVGRQVMAEMRASFLGDRLCGLGVSTAPTTAELKRFLAECFQLPVGEGYGSTEAGVMTYGDRVVRPPVLDYKIRDVPELGYFTTDRPYPRGEFCVRTALATPGYYKRPEATANLFDEEGFLRTGDIVEERGPDHVVLIDRSNDVLKLSQGEFVALGQLGNALENGSDVIHQAYVYGTSARPFVLAVIVPNPDVVGRLLGPDADETAVRGLVRAEMVRIAAKEQLKPFEVPRDFIIETEPFTHENGLLSSVHKRLRPALRARYGPRLEEIYDRLERDRNDELMALADLGNGMSVLERLGRALQASLGVSNVDPTEPYGFLDLGGDSLGAASFAKLIEDIFGVTLSVNAILSPAGNPRKWARDIEAALAEQGTSAAAFDRIHGKGATEVSADDLHVRNFLDAGTLRQAPTLPPAREVRTVLLTGVTGFLGRFLCLEWLEYASTVGGKLICLVRAADESSARRRLDAVFSGGDLDLAERFTRLSADHLQVVVGDVAEPLLGLSPASFERLARDVDHISHCGALVNHVLPYEDLFGPNVVGVAELVRLSVTERRKSIGFVSSLAATLMTDRASGVDEHTPLLPKAPCTFGYGTSKWAAEQLLGSAHRDLGVPVTIFRGDMMLAHRTYAGQINTADVFTRLLTSVIRTGLAPGSFYPAAAPGQRAEHYDGLPVDFVAGAVVGLSTEPRDDLRVFHVVNHHDDGVSLDTFVDWIEEAGYPLRRIPDYHAWFELFEAKLRALPEAERQQTSLNVLRNMREPRRSEQPVGSGEFRRAVRSLRVGPEVPRLTREFLHKVLADLVRHGFIPEPTTRPSEPRGATSPAR